MRCGYTLDADTNVADVYRIPISSPAATAKELKSRALLLQPLLEDVQVKHPLVCTFDGLVYGLTNSRNADFDSSELAEIHS